MTSFVALTPFLASSALHSGKEPSVLVFCGVFTLLMLLSELQKGAETLQKDAVGVFVVALQIQSAVALGRRHVPTHHGESQLLIESVLAAPKGFGTEHAWLRGILLSGWMHVDYFQVLEGATSLEAEVVEAVCLVARDSRIFWLTSRPLLATSFRRRIG